MQTMTEIDIDFNEILKEYRNGKQLTEAVLEAEIESYIA